ncbi:MAG TPA: hypothetical protein VLZ81_03740 [Blastocatellia bacterium]|nr:hypothetical protein [Blastocatellia bacterium]
MGEPNSDSREMPNARRASRRRFLKSAGAGVLGASLLHSSRTTGWAAEKEVGTITLDALMLAYIGAVPGNRGSSVFMPLKGYQTIISLSVPGITLTASTPPGPNVEGFIQQSESRIVPGALNIAQAPHITATVNNGSGPPANSAVYGILSPKLKLKGTPEALKFHLVIAIQAFAVEISQLLQNPAMFDMSNDTAASMAAQYVSNVTDLTAPRYQQQQLFAAGQGSDTLFSSADFGTGVAQTSVTAKIESQTGFTSQAVKDALAVGNNITVTYNSGFDKPSGKVMSLEITGGDVPFTTYLDTVFKSVVLVPADG